MKVAKSWALALLLLGCNRQEPAPSARDLVAPDQPAAQRVFKDLKSQGDAAVPGLLSTIRRSGAPDDERSAAATMLGSLGTPKALAECRAILSKASSDTVVQYSVAGGLSMSDRREAEEVLLVARNTKDPFLKMTVANSLAEVGTRRSLGWLSVQAEGSTPISSAAKEAIRRIKSRRN